MKPDSLKFEDLPKERKLSSDMVKGVAESGAYQPQRKFYEILEENISSFISSTIASFAVGTCSKYFGGKTLDPLVMGVTLVPLTDLVEYNLVPETKRDLGKTFRNDVGTFSGTVLGYTLASLL